MSKRGNINVSVKFDNIPIGKRKCRDEEELDDFMSTIKKKLG